MLKTTDLKITFLGIIPKLTDETGTITPEQIAALSALLTFKGKSVKGLLKEAADKGQDLQKKTEAILRKSSLRGHASITTTPTLAFTFEASKFLDLLLTGLTFASGLMASGRRTETTADDVVCPTRIYKSYNGYKCYKKASEKNINFVNRMLDRGIAKDQARKILQYGLYGTGTIVLPLESVVSFAKEMQDEGRQWMPEESRFLLERIMRAAGDFGVEYLLKTRMLAPKDPYPYPNTFKNPKTPNLVRDLRREYPLSKGLSQLVGLQSLSNLSHLGNLRKTVRDYNPAVRAVFLTRGSWCVWTEKKRHRTAFMVADSVYHGIEEAIRFFKQNKKAIASGKLNRSLVDKAGWYMAMPPAVRSNNDLMVKWLNGSGELLRTYERLLKLGIKPSDAIFIIPRGIKFDMVQEYNLYNLIAGYLPLRLCSTADEQIQALAYEEAGQLKKKLPFLARHIAPKCHGIGWCPEEQWCGKIKAFDKGYNQAKHERKHRELEEGLKNPKS